jgi:hypothetical protein
MKEMVEMMVEMIVEMEEILTYLCFLADNILKLEGLHNSSESLFISLNISTTKNDK